MARRKLINSQLANVATYNMYLRKMLTLAENVFQIDGLSTFVDLSYINKQLLRKGSIAFFVDEVLGLIALPYVNISNLDIYGRPDKIQCIAQNGYTTPILNRDEYVIMYDNMGRYPLYLDISQLAERIALATRVADINIGQQRTPRFFKTPQDKVQSVKDMLNNIDGFEETILSYDGMIGFNDMECVLNPAPYVADKLVDYKQEIWSEYLQLIGITSLSSNKKERLIQDEVIVQMGGTIASRYNRYTPRKIALDEIKNKFNIELNLSYYDGLPTTLESFEDNMKGGEKDENDI